MGTESDGFPDEPTFNLAALAGQELLQARIRDLENERARKVLVDPEDLREVLRHSLGGVLLGGEAWTRLATAAELDLGHALGGEQP